MSRSATSPFLAGLFLLCSLAQLLLYRDSFDTKPSQDDFISLHQIERGEQQGALTFFRASDVGDYRPLQNLTFWAFGRGAKHRIIPSLRILHFLSFAVYAGVAFLWIYSLRLTRTASIAAALVLFFHPVLAGPLAGLDNYSRFVVSALVWLGAWLTFRLSNTRPLLTIVLVSICLVVGLGYMEYAVGLIPLAVLGMAWRVERRRLLYAAVMGAALAAVLAAYFLVRISGAVSTSSGAGYVSRSPLVWAKNAGIITAATLFFGNTVPVMLTHTRTALAWLGGNVLVTFLALSYGLWIIQRSPERGRIAVSPVILVIALALTLFPVVLMMHISEIYLTQVVLGFALVVGVAAEGWLLAPRLLQLGGGAFAAAELVLAVNAVEHKIAGINEAGQRTDAMMRDLLRRIPAGRDAGRVAMIFAAPDGKGYSVFSRTDDDLVQTGYATEAFHWFRPEQPIRLDHLVVAKAAEVNLSDYDAAFLWDSAAGAFTRLAPDRKP